MLLCHVAQGKRFQLCEYGPTDTGCQSVPKCKDIPGGLCAFRPDCSLPPVAICFVSIVGSTENALVSLFGNCENGATFIFNQALGNCTVHRVFKKQYITKITVVDTGHAPGLNINYYIIMMMMLLFLWF